MRAFWVVLIIALSAAGVSAVAQAHSHSWRPAKFRHVDRGADHVDQACACGATRCRTLLPDGGVR